MNPRTLAKTLRRRQLRKGLVDKWSINALPDSEILDAYLVCCKCAGELFENRDAVVRNAGSIDEFLTFVEMALASHVCQNRN